MGFEGFSRRTEEIETSQGIITVEEFTIFEVQNYLKYPPQDRLFYILLFKWPGKKFIPEDIKKIDAAIVRVNAPGERKQQSSGSGKSVQVELQEAIVLFCREFKEGLFSTICNYSARQLYAWLDVTADVNEKFSGKEPSGRGKAFQEEMQAKEQKLKGIKMPDYDSLILLFSKKWKKDSEEIQKKYTVDMLENAYRNMKMKEVKNK